MSVYEKVRAYIDENGIKQVAVAQKSGISSGDIQCHNERQAYHVCRRSESDLSCIECQPRIVY